MDSDIKLHSQIYQFRLPLRKSIIINGKTISSRQGLILKLSSGNSNKGFAEISPLPGLNFESYDNALFQLQKICRQNALLEQIYTEIERDRNYTNIDVYPSVRFGLESAMIDLIAHQNSITPAQVLDAQNSVRNIKVNGLITRGDDILSQVQYFIKHRYESIKIKLGQDPVVNEIDKLNNIATFIGDKLSLRIDANQSWTLSQAVQFYKGIQHLPVDYIEEPLKNAIDLPELYKDTGMPLALDETLQQTDLIPDLLQSCKALILKPAVVGGVLSTCRMINLASVNNVKSIISDTFQSGLGLTMLANLSALADADRVPMGLDTARWLKDDLLQHPGEIKN